MKRLTLALLMFVSWVAFGATPEQETALRDMGAFASAQAKSDPHADKIEAELAPMLETIVAQNPVSEWLSVVKKMYFAISARVHREERERIRADEYAQSPGNGTPSQREGWLRARFEILEGRLLAGKIGPREHALRMLEAASIHFPDDAPLIAWRRAKVAIATAYEMGTIGRTEYDDRWAAATSTYDEATGNRSRQIAEAEARLLSEAERARVESYLRSRPTTCTTAMVLGRLQTTCR